MLDLQRMKETIDLRQWVEKDIGQPNRRSSKAWLWRCPFHAEQHGYSLAVWADGWRCFGACGEGGDIIAWLQKRNNLSFKDAITILGDDMTLVTMPLTPTIVHQPKSVELPGPEWQEAALKFVELAQATLWSSDGERAFHYLHQERGLYRETIRKARLGYIPGHYREWRTIDGLSIPCGITIPWFADEMLWAVKVRRAAGNTRYEQVSGGKIASGLYWADNLLPGWIALVVEGEFNCLTAWQEALDLVCPVSLGSASTPLNPYWFATLATCPRILACFDDDDAGRKAAKRLQSLTPRAKFIRVPEGKDINEYKLLRHNDFEPVRTWLSEQLESLNQ